MPILFTISIAFLILAYFAMLGSAARCVFEKQSDDRVSPAIICLMLLTLGFAALGVAPNPQ